MKKRAILLLLVVALTSVTRAGNVLNDNQLVKTTAGYFVFDSALSNWIFNCSTGVSFSAGRTANVSPLSGDPGHTANPIEAVPGHGGCAIFDSNGDGNGDFNFNLNFRSLRDIGTWTITTSCVQVNASFCASAVSPPCNIVCDPAGLTADPDPPSFVISVFNSAPTASITHSPTPAFNATVTLDSHANDPDHGTSGLSHHWNLSGKPASSAASLSSTTVATPTIHFTSDADIGHYSFSLDVDDTEGERVSTSHSFDVPNVPPTISVADGGDINALVDIAPVATVADPDGHTPTVVWDIVSSPATSTHGAQSNVATTPSFPPIVTTDRDIGQWRLRITATDNEGPSATPSGVTSQDVNFRVLNLPPQINFVGAHSIRVGDPIHAETTVTDDEDGGALTLRWEVVQVPHSAGVAVHSVLSTSAILDMPTTLADAGTWIFKLTATDNEGPTAVPSGEISDEFTILVDADPTADIALSASGTVVSTDPPTISATSFPMTLSAAGSVDPDSPCPTDPNHCHDTDGRPASVSPGIVGYQWSLIDVPPELFDRFFTGRVDEVLGIGGSGQTLTIPSFLDLAAGQWTFELEVFDGEGNSATATQSVVVLDPNTPPIAVVSAPARYLVDPITGGVAANIVLSGTGSFDLDNVLSGTPITAGVIDFTWHLTAPSGCTSVPIPPSGAGAVTFTLFAAGASVPGSCQGVWSVRLEVGDDDMPQLHGSAETTVLIGNCPLPMCIDAPTTILPERIDFSDRTDVMIYYHLDSTVYGNAVFSAGAFVRLDIYHELDPVTPFYSALDPNVLATDRGSLLVFNWNGYGNSLIRPVSGRYNVVLTLVDSAFATTPFTAAEPASIIIAVAEITIGDTSDRWTRFEELDTGATALHFNYSIAGGVTIDRLHWRVRDAATSLLSEADIPVANAGTATWNGKVGGITLAPANYRFELEAFRIGASVGRSTPFTFTIYKLNVKPHTGVAPAQGFSVLVNNDDDDTNGASDVTQNPPGAGEDDLAQIDLEMVPTLPGQVTLSADPGAAAFTVWPAAAKGVAIALPQTYDTSAVALPANVFLEGTASGHRELRLQFQPMTGPALPVRGLALNLVQIDVLLDTNNNHTIDAGDLPTFFTRISRWDNAYGVAPGFAVANAADPANFVEQDPSRFYVRVQDPAANADPAVAETIHLNLGTITAAAVVNDALVDEPLTETGPNTGVFVSRSQLLTTNDLPLNPDDGFAADSGAGAAVADNLAGDRTHKADMDGSIRFTYQPPGAAAAVSRTLPVGQRAPESRKRVKLRIHIFNEPFQDVGFGAPVHGAGNGVFDFQDVNLNGRHDAGEPSEPYFDFSSGAITAHRGDDIGVADGRGPIATAAQVTAQTDRAILAWSPAEIKFENVSVSIEDAPKVAGVDILLDGDFSLPWAVTPSDYERTFNAYRAMMTNDTIDVFYVGPMTGANAATAYSDYQPFAHDDFEFVFIGPNLDIRYRTLAHEMGHGLTNQDDSANNQYIFFPYNLAPPFDDALNQYRRFPLVTETNARTSRAVGTIHDLGNHYLVWP